jgi:hypothetical protein
MQLNYGDILDIQSQFGIYLLDTDFQFKFIAPVDTKLHYAQKVDLSSKFETKIVVNLQKQDINSTLEDLIALPW